MDNKKKYEYIGDISQLFRVDSYRLEGGKGDGVRATEITNETGLNFTVIADRCMDIAYLRYKGINISYINQCGIVSPKYYDNRGTNWLKSFTGGFFTTCGLDNTGSPCEDGESHGLHGRISHIPAAEYCVKTNEGDNGRYVTISGEMNQSSLFGDKLKLKREIKAFQTDNKIIIEDEICNTGFLDEEFMLLYHFNIGYPFLCPHCEVMIPSEEVIPANEHSAAYLEDIYKITEPNTLDEMCYFHKLKSSSGTSTVGLFNPQLNIGFTLTFENHILEKFIQWKNLCKGQYVIGLEPSTNYARGKAEERKNGVIKTIPPLSSVKHQLTIQFYDSKEEMDGIFEE